jgi:hypothetical protein
MGNLIDLSKQGKFMIRFIKTIRQVSECGKVLKKSHRKYLNLLWRGSDRGSVKRGSKRIFLSAKNGTLGIAN